MFIEPTITWVPSGFSGYIWLDTKICVEKKKKYIGHYLGKEIVVEIKNVTIRFLDHIFVNIDNNIKLVMFIVTEI